MAKAKKKLNKQVAAAVLSTAIILGGGGYMAAKLYRGKYRPAQFKAQGRELMLKGDYEGAYAFFGRAAGSGSLTTDMEFLGWMYETSLRRTSFNDTAFRNSRALLEAMLATQPNDIPTIVHKLKFDLDLIDAGGAEQYGAEQAKRMGELADKVLASDPKDRIGIRAQSVALTLPVFKQDTTQTSEDVAAILTELRKRLEAHPDNPDLLTLYALATARHREVLLRERAIDSAPTDPRVAAMFEDLNTRVESLLKALADESQPAEQRAMGYSNAARVDLVIAQSGFLATREAAEKVLQRRSKSIELAAAIVPPASPMYVPFRLEQANLLNQQERVVEAEALLRETIKGAPLSWQPRLFLAEMLSDRGRPTEALELVTADLQPSAELMGLAGYQFFLDRRQVPLRRALYRLQTYGTAKPEDRPALLTAVQADYDLAIADGKIAESEPAALQVKAGLLEINQDRTGAVRMLTRALEGATNDRFKLKIQQQLVGLNLALNQPGAASEMLSAMIKTNPALTPQAKVNAIIQLIDLYIRNGQPEQARSLIEQAKVMLPNNPAVMALEIKLMSDPQQRRTALAKLPEDTQPQKFFKFKFAGELEDEPTIRRLAGELLKADPNSVDVAMLWGDYLRRHDKKDEALAVFQAAQVAHPDNKTIELLIKDTQAVTKEQREGLLKEMVTDPYRLALLDAEQARLANNADEYVKKLTEAEQLDKNKDGSATERLALWYIGSRKETEAAQAIDRLAALQRDPAQARVLRIRLAMATNKLTDAAAQADSLTSELPDFSTGWVVKGQVHNLNNQPAQAIDAFETALAKQPENVEALRGLVESADRAGRRDVLKRYIDQGLRVTKNDDFFVDWSLRYELTFGDPTTTIEPRLKRRDAQPDNPNNWAALAQSYLTSAAAKDRAGEQAAATDYRNKAGEVLAQGADKFPKVPGFTLESAKLLAQTGDTAGALKRIDSLDDNPDLTPDLQATRAQFYAELGKPDAAAALLQKQIDGGKASDTIRMQLAGLQAGQGQPDAALKTLEPVADSPQVRETRVNIYLSANRLAEAQRVVDDALAKERSVPNLLMAAMMQARQNKTPDAIKLVDEAVALDGENAAARFTRARIMLSERPLRNTDLIADLEVVRKNQPTNVEARMLLAERLRAIGRGAEATQELEALQRVVPGDRRVVTQLVRGYAAETPPRYGRIDQLLADLKKQGGPPDPQMLALESSVALQKGDGARAVEAARAAAKAAPEDMGAFRGLLNVMLRVNKYDDVIAEVDRVEQGNKSIYWTYLTRGIALHRMKRDDDAAKEFDRAIGLATALKDSSAAVNEVATTYAREYGAEQASTWLGTKLPDEASTHVLQMRLLSEGGKTDKAIAAGEQLTASMKSLPVPDQVNILTTLGTAYLTDSPPQADKARETFEQLNALQPDNIMTLNNLAYAITLSGSGPAMQDAVKYSQRADELSRQNGTPNALVLDTYGWALVQAGDLDHGLAILREALEIGSLPETEYHIGEVFVLQGQKDAALSTLKSALARVNQAKQNGQMVDATLLAHIGDAIRRAEAIATP